MLEEVCEFLEPLGFLFSKPHDELSYLADGFKSKQDWAIRRLAGLEYWQRMAIVDACCDINVTSVGVMQLLGGVDVLGAQREVIRSNNSKMVDGKFEFDANGKIMKPESYSEPDLTPFISTMQNNKGE
jgi:predicted HAD superfamily Cof-like phosphohydrolase